MHRKTADSVARGIIKILAAFTVAILVLILSYLIYRGMRYSTQKDQDVLQISIENQDFSIYAHKDSNLDVVDWFTLRSMALGRVRTLRTISKVNQKFRLYVDPEIADKFKAYLDIDSDENIIFDTGDGVDLSKDEGGMIVQALGKNIPSNYNSVGIQDTVIAVNPGVTQLDGNQRIKALTLDDVDKLRDGEITSWRELGGPNIRPIYLEDASVDQIAATPGMATLMKANTYFEAEGIDLIKSVHFLKGWNIDLKYLLEPAEESGVFGGISSIVFNTFAMILIVILIAAPIGIGAAVYLALYAKGRASEIARRGIDLLSGVPSIIFGLFGMLVFVQLFGWGFSLISGSLTLVLMILPTIIRTSEEAIKSVDSNLIFASRGLGATKTETIYQIVLPAAKNGITTGIILGIGRALGETAALIFTIGSSTDFVQGLASSSRVLAQHVYLTIIEGQSMDRAFAASLILIVLELFINTVSRKLMYKGKRNGK